jgi:hypothetical protein
MFEIATAINDFADKITSIPGISKIVNNPIYTALLITVIIMLVIAYIFRNAETDDPLFTMVLRGGFYVFMFMTAIIFFHNHVLLKENQIAGGHEELNEVFRSGIVIPEESRINVSNARFGISNDINY